MPATKAHPARRKNQEPTMKFAAQMFVTVAVAFLLACPLRADDTPTPGTAKKAVATSDKDGTANSHAAPTAGEAAPAAPAPAPAPPRGSRDDDTPRLELFLGYSNVLATPKSLANRIVDVQ